MSERIPLKQVVEEFVKLFEQNLDNGDKDTNTTDELTMGLSKLQNCFQFIVKDNFATEMFKICIIELVNVRVNRFV